MNGWSRGWAQSSGRHVTQIEKAIRNSSTTHKQTNTKVYFNGVGERISTFEGARWHATGRMDFWHHDARVLSVDFDRDMVTDFGYTGFSPSTNSNIMGWFHQLRRMGFMGALCLSSAGWPLDWTLSDRHNPKSPVVFTDKTSHGERLHTKFRVGAPWVKRIDGEPWFDGRAFDVEAVKRGDRVNSEICDGVSWRWFTADWVNGLWTKRFIDDHAEALWNARRRRMEKDA